MTVKAEQADTEIGDQEVGISTNTMSYESIQKAQVIERLGVVAEAW